MSGYTTLANYNHGACGTLASAMTSGDSSQSGTYVVPVLSQPGYSALTHNKKPGDCQGANGFFTIDQAYAGPNGLYDGGVCNQSYQLSTCNGAPRN